MTDELTEEKLADLRHLDGVSGAWLAAPTMRALLARLDWQAKQIAVLSRALAVTAENYHNHLGHPGAWQECGRPTCMDNRAAVTP